MKTEHTLRYLLLRHLELFKSTVPDALLREVTGSLRVDSERGGFVVIWTAKGEPHDMRFARDAFAFYVRGDTRPEKRSLNDELGNQNERLAAEFAQQALCWAPYPSRAAPVPLALDSRRAGVWDAVFALVVAAVGGLGLYTGLAILGASLGEYLRRGRLIGSAGLVVLALLGPAAAALLGALAYGTLHFLDPDPRWRRSRVAICSGAIALAGLRLASGETDWTLGVAALTVVLALTAAVLRSLRAFHFRALPLALPFYCVGLAAEGHAVAAGVGIAVLLLSTFDLSRAAPWPDA